MGFLDHYRQYEGLSEREVSEELRVVSAERRAKALARVEPVDLSRTTWPGLPHPYVVNAIIYAARRGLHAYADPRAGALRSEIAHRHGVASEQVAVGNGAAQLLAAATTALLEPGDELVTPWPSYPLYPLMARRAHGRPVPVPGFSVEGILSAVTPHTRVVVVCNPNDPTGELLRAAELEALLDALPERVVVLLDEALVDFVDAQPIDTSIGLLERWPRLLVVRSFSKAWGLAGLRTGYAVGPPGASAVLEQLEPDLGVDDLAQAGTLEALRSTPDAVARRAAEAAAERDRVTDALRRAGVEVTASQANVVWLRAPGVDGTELAARLEHQGVIVQSGAGIGEPAYVRAAVHLREHGDRLLRAMETALSADGRVLGAAAR